MEVELTPVVRYWDLETHEIPALLQDLKAKGLRTVGAWVPWADLESDQKHRLRRFLTQAIRFGFKVRLGVTPEVAIGYPNGGVPHDLLRKPENIAQDRSGQPIYSFAPPNMHPLANLIAPQVFQRFGHFLVKLSQEVKEVLVEHFDAEIDLVVGDSFFKHYRTLGLAPEDHGDFASLYFQRELDAIRDWNPARAERTFRVRAVDFLQSRFSCFENVSVQTRNHCVRSGSLDRLLDELVGSGVAAEDLFDQFYKARHYCDAIWCDDLSALNELGLKFVLSGGMMLYGDIWVPVDDVTRLSERYLSRLTAIGESFSSTDHYFEQNILCIVKNRFALARVSQIMHEKLGPRMRIASSLFDVPDSQMERTKLLFVEEALNIDNEQFRALIDRAKRFHCTIALFRSALCKRSQADLSCYETFQIKHGWEYEIAIFPDGGQVIVIAGHESSLTNMTDLVARVQAVAGSENIYASASQSVKSIFIRNNADPETTTAFLFNPSDSVEDITFTLPVDVQISGIDVTESERSEEHILFERKQSVAQIPPLAVVPLQLSNVSRKETPVDLFIPSTETLVNDSEREAKLV